MTYAEVTRAFLLVCVAALGVMEIFCLIRAILGPRISDRIVGINMIGTQIIISSALVALLLGEADIAADIVLVFAFLNFLSVVIITRIYIGIYAGQSKRGGRRAGDAAPQQQERRESQP